MKTPLRDIVINKFTATELIRLAMRKRDEEDNSDSEDDDEDDEEESDKASDDEVGFIIVRFVVLRLIREDCGKLN